MSDGDRDLRKYSRRSAIGLMGVGGGLAATETLGFTNLTAGRGVEVAVDGDDDAVLRVVDEGNGIPLQDQEPFDNKVEIKFENESNTGINSNDLSVTIKNQDDSDTDVDVDDFDSETETESISPGGSSGEFNTDLGVSSQASLTVELNEKDENNTSKIDVDVNADFGSGEFSVDFIRTDINIKGTGDW